MWYAHSYLINTPLDDKPSTAGRNKTLKDRFEVAGDLLESALYCFIFSLVKDFHKFFD